MKLVIIDGYALNPGDIAWEEITSQFTEVKIYDRTDIADWELSLERLQGVEVLVTNKFPVNKQVIDACPKLRAVAVTATGYNIVDTEYAKEKGIAVMNVPAYGTMIVSQFTVGLLLTLCARYEHHSRAVRAGRWAAAPDFCFWDYPITELAGKTAGIIGLGRIGRATAKALGALGMRVLAHSRSQCEEGRAVAEYVTLDTLLQESDVILLHCPLFPETEGMINAQNIAKMKDGVILINTSRGQLVDEQALAKALESGKIAAAGVDVVSTEPIQADNPLLQAPNCLITPHIAWASVAARERIMSITAENIRTFLLGKPQNIVNK